MYYLHEQNNINETIPEFTFETENKSNKIIIKLDKKEYWFMMGYYVRNGWVQSKLNNYIMFSFQEPTFGKFCNEIMEKIERVLPITYKMCSTGKCTEFGSYNNFPSKCSKNFTWYSILKEFGENISEKVIPEWVYDAPKEYIQEFINGYKKSNDYMVTDSFDVAFGIQKLYVKLNKLCSITITPIMSKDNTIRVSLLIHNTITII